MCFATCLFALLFSLFCFTFQSLIVVHQFHYNLGKVLLSVCDGKNVGDTILVIATQINHGSEFILKDDELCLKIVKLNMSAGKMAIESCRHKTAYAYLEVASSLLPNDHWESHYDISLRLGFMMASAANSSCKYDNAERILQRILKEARCTKDKLPSYFLLSQSKCIVSCCLVALTWPLCHYVDNSPTNLLHCRLSPVLQGQGKVVDAYRTCSSILTQLGETIPETVEPEEAVAIIQETLRKYDEVHSDDRLGKKMEDCTLRYVVKFYAQMVTSAFFFKVPHIITYFVCKAVQISLDNGVCQYTPLSFLQLANMIIRNASNASLAQ